MGYCIKQDGINKLGRVFQKQINRTVESPLIIDFGLIQEDYSLKTNTFPIPIPVTDYQVCRYLTLGKEGAVLGSTQENQGSHSHAHSNDGSHSGHLSGDGSHSHASHGGGDHIHDALVSSKMCSIKPGDRVIVAWVQNDAVVLGILAEAKEVTEDE